MTSDASVWRLVRSGFADGYENMAVDEALMLSIAEGKAPPTLRLYGWRPPGVSLGYFQAVEGQIDPDECKRRGYTVVRRPTGGRAILHDDEVTYSVAVRQADLAEGERLIASYREISRGIEAGLRRIGVGAAMANGSGQWSVVSGQQRKTAQAGGAPFDSAQGKLRLRPPTTNGKKRRGPVGDAPKPLWRRRESPPSSGGQGRSGVPAACFAKAARSDMTVDGRKIVGSAQARRHGAILQHGSIPLRVNVEDVAAVMAPDSAGASALAAAAVSVSDAAGRGVTFEEMCEALVAGFEEGLGVTLAEGELTDEERELTVRLREEKYGTDRWNLERPGAQAR